jgi:Ribosomal protein S1
MAKKNVGDEISEVVNTTSEVSDVTQSGVAADDLKSDSADQTRRQVIKASRQRSVQANARREENERINASWSSLVTAMHKNSTLLGTIFGIERLPCPKTDDIEAVSKSVTVSVLLNDQFKATIPFGDMYRENPLGKAGTDLSTEQGVREYQRRMEQFLSKMIDIEIPLVITDLFRSTTDDGDYYVIGSRKKAIDIIEKANFTPDSNGVRMLNEGDETLGRITSVARYSMAMNVGGIDVTAQAGQLTYQYVDNLHNFYKPGETIPVVIREITAEKGQTKISVTCKPLELEAAKSRAKLITPGLKTTAIITSIRTSRENSNNVVLHAYADTLKVPVTVGSMPRALFGTPPVSGDKIGITITALTEHGIARATCTRIVSSKNFTGR